MTTIINKTPHALNIVNTAGDIITIAPSFPAARVDTLRTEGEPIGGFATQTVSMGAVIDLPDPAADTIYIVSAIVLQQVPNRPDVFAPGELLRDEGGRVIGAKGLTRNSASNTDAAAKRQVEFYVYDGHDASQFAKDLTEQGIQYTLNDTYTKFTLNLPLAETPEGEPTRAELLAECQRAYQIINGAGHASFSDTRAGAFVWTTMGIRTNYRG